MFKWLENKIYGKYIARIQELDAYAYRQNGVCAELREKYSKQVHENNELQEKLDKAREIISNIELSYHQDNNLNHVLLHHLHVVDRPYVEIHTAINPLSLCRDDVSEHDHFMDERIDKQRLELSTRLVVSGVSPPQFAEEATHELMVALASECGKRVENEILLNAGWRV